MNAMKDHLDPVDCHVGRRLRIRRTLLNFSQATVAKALGVSFQQVQKYERGANRISASRLYDLAAILKTDVAYFFADFDDEDRPATEALEIADPVASDLSRSESLELLRDYWGLPDNEMRARFRDLLQVATQGASRTKA